LLVDDYPKMAVHIFELVSLDKLLMEFREYGISVYLACDGGTHIRTDPNKNRTPV
jgi:hypothetical protein